VGGPIQSVGGFTSGVALLRGLIAGLLIAALQIAGGHVSFEYQRTSLHGSELIATAVPVFLLPLALAWGWTWASDRWSGRSRRPLLLFTLGLALSASSGFALEYVLFPPATGASAGALIDLVALGVLFVVPVVAFAALLYWEYASGKVHASFGTLALGYLSGLLLALVLPTLAMGAVAGTAAGHSWQNPRARGAVSLLVVLLMLVAVFELPMAVAASASLPALP
jgi:hypothetical protein